MSPVDHPNLEVIRTITREFVEGDAQERSLVRESQVADVDALAAHEEKKRNLDLEDRKTYLDQRKSFAKWIFALVATWQLVMFLYLFFAMLCAVPAPPPPEVLIALISAATVNVFAVLLVVAKYLFPVKS